MATVLDITSKLQQEEKVLKIGDKEFPVDDTKNTVIRAMALMDEDDSIHAMDKALALLLGENGLKALDDMNLSFTGYKNVFMAVIALASDASLEDMEARFQKVQ